MKSARSRIASILSTIGVIAIVLAVLPHFEYRGGVVNDQATVRHLQQFSDHLPYSESYRFGWYFSPLIEHRSAREIAVSANGSFSLKQSSQFHVGWISWSMLSLIIGLALTKIGSKIRPVPATHQVS